MKRDRTISVSNLGTASTSAAIPASMSMPEELERLGHARVSPLRALRL